VKTLIATTVIALSLLASAASATPFDSQYGNYPAWAQKAFTSKGK
jgi:hypothetical protein